jgi:hypothetical protein
MTWDVRDKTMRHQAVDEEVAQADGLAGGSEAPR